MLSILRGPANVYLLAEPEHIVSFSEFIIAIYHFNVGEYMRVKFTL